jgi:signal transduction histidine kinase
MTHANEIFFLVTALILWGLLIGSVSIFKSSQSYHSGGLWWYALALMACALTFFAVAPSTHLLFLTLANTCFIGSYVYLLLFCRSLNTPIGQTTKSLALIGVIVFGLVFEYLRQDGTYTQRVVFVVLTACACILATLWELRPFKQGQSTQLRFLALTLAVVLVIGVARLIGLGLDNMPPSTHLYQEPFLITVIRWLAFAFSALCYVAMIGYWMEKIITENAKVAKENHEITELLKDKERLISGLMKVNKTAATGALSASIAHELNQPLGASNLNIQFLKTKLEKGALNPELGREVLDSLEADNQRAATIVKSLRSMFADGKFSSQNVQIRDLVLQVIDIVRPELKFKNIETQLSLDTNLVVDVNPAEIKQVILNLINNSIQSLDNSSDLGRKIHIKTSKAGGLIQISIADNGEGVPADFKNQLFELLSTTKKAGMGLGLWLSKHTVVRYGGSIRYEDIGRGANFVIELPGAVSS